jgi:hypothetical protein
MQKKPRKTKPNAPANPLQKVNFKSFYEETKKKEKVKHDSYKKLQKEYEDILNKKLKREHRAYRIIFNNHPDLLFIGFGANRGSVKWKASKYFRDSFNPFFSGEDANRKMLECHAYRVQELDKYGLVGIIPIPELMRVLDVSMPCSVCKKENFTYSDYKEGNCYVIEGEGNLNQFTKGYLLCHDCYKKYLGK